MGKILVVDDNWESEAFYPILGLLISCIVFDFIVRNPIWFLLLLFSGFLWGVYDISKCVSLVPDRRKH